MDTQKWFEATLAELKNDADFRLETIILDLTEQISTRMKERGLTQAKLAKVLGVTPAAVTKILKGSPNFTLKTLLKVADALQVEVSVFLGVKADHSKTMITQPYVQAQQKQAMPSLTAVGDGLTTQKASMVAPNYYNDTEATGPLYSGPPSC